MANTRLCLGVEVQGGKEHAARHGLPGLWSLPDALPRTHWPAFVRGSQGYGNEVLLGECEARAPPCFFKLRHTAKVKTLLAQMQRAGAAWTDAGEGWEVIEARLRLSGWSRERRVVPFDRLRAFGSCAKPRPSRRLARPPASLFPTSSSVGEHARRRRDTFAPALPGADGWSQSPTPARPSASLPIPLRRLGGADASPCSSPPWMKSPAPPSRWPGSTAEEEEGDSGGRWVGEPSAPTPNRAERDSQRAEPLPEGQRRRALAKHLRRTQKPMGLVRLHHAKARAEPAHGQPRRAPLQLVAPLRAALRRRAPPRSHPFDRLRAFGTSRPALLHGVARLTRSGGQRTVKVSLAHEKSDLLGAAITQVSNTLARFHASAEQWSVEERWTLLLTHIFRHWLGGKWLGQLPPEAESLLSG